MKVARTILNLTRLSLFLGLGGLASTANAAETHLSLTYAIAVGNLSIGTVAVEATFIEGGYAVALRGATSGVSRIVTNATATMGARGNIRGTRILPAEFELAMTEGGVTAEANMAIRNRSVTDLSVFPGLTPDWDRVHLTMDHVRNVVDPMSAMIVALPPGETVTTAACNQHLPVFDGWERFDVDLSYRESRTVVSTEAGGYSGPVIICTARYTPVAGHQPGHPPVQYMTGNDRLEAWLMPVAGQNLMIPYRLLIGTELGDLTITVRSLEYRPRP